jgi:hypothetical protein
MNASTKSVLLALAVAGLSAVITAPVSAQVFKPRDQTCDNKSTARDKTLRPDTRCLQGGPRKEKWDDSRVDRFLANDLTSGQARANANKPLVPGGPLRRDYVPTNLGSGGGGGGSSKGKKPR